MLMKNRTGQFRENSHSDIEKFCARIKRRMEKSKRGCKPPVKSCISPTSISMFPFWSWHPLSLQSCNWRNPMCLQREDQQPWSVFIFCKIIFTRFCGMYVSKDDYLPVSEWRNVCFSATVTMIKRQGTNENSLKFSNGVGSLFTWAYVRMPVMIQNRNLGCTKIPLPHIPDTHTLSTVLPRECMVMVVWCFPGLSWIRWRGQWHMIEIWFLYAKRGERVSRH